MLGPGPSIFSTASIRAKLASAFSLESLLSARVDIAWLTAFRALFGLLMAISAARFLVYGWVDRLFVEPTFRFHYYGFDWVEPLPAPFLHWLFYALVGAGLFVSLGLLYRWSALFLALGLTYFQLLDVSNYLNHYYLAALLAWFLVFLPAARRYSVDSWLRGRKGDPTVSVVSLYLLRFQIGIVYFCAGLAKAQSDWLLHAQPLRIWLSAKSDLPLLGPLLAVEPTALIFSWVGFLFDTTVPLFLLNKRTRPFAFAVVIIFHSMTRLLFPIGMFPFIMVLSALVFFSPSWPRHLFQKLGLNPGVLQVQDAPIADSKRRLPSSVLALATVLIVVQLIVPARSLFYPGNVLWHEQGMRLSWRVMVRAKGGNTVFRVERHGQKQVQYVSPRQYLTGLQESEMSSQPDLILQLAHHIARQLDDVGPVAVYAESRVALNGRRSALLIDPNVDLTQVRDGWAPAHYILPAPAGPPPHTRPTR